MSATKEFTMTVCAVKVEEAAPPVCWTGGGLTVRLALAVAFVPAAGVVVASAADDDDDTVAEEGSLLGAEEDDEAEDSEAELDAELELELEPPGVIPPDCEPGSVAVPVNASAAALYASKVFAPL